MPVPPQRLTPLAAVVLASLLTPGCIQYAEDMTFLDLQQEPAATGLATHGWFELHGGVAAPGYVLRADDSLWTVDLPYDWETEGYAEHGAIWSEVVHLVSDTPGEHTYTLAWTVEGEPHTATGTTRYETPAGFGLDLSPWRYGRGWEVPTALVLHRETSVRALRLLSADGVPLIGDGDLPLLADAAGALWMADDAGVPVVGGVVEFDAAHATPDAVDRVALLDGREVSLPPVRHVSGYDEVTADWTLAVRAVPYEDFLVVEVDDPTGAPFLFPDAWLDNLPSNPALGPALAVVDGIPNDGALGCTAEFTFAVDQPAHTVTICLGSACSEADLPGWVSRETGDGPECPW